MFSLIPGYDPYINSEDYYFDERAALAAVAFIENELTLTKGKWKGQPFILAGWQRAAIMCLFGWKHKKTHLRRYRKMFCYIPRKNGKSQFVAAIANTILFCDGENDGEIYIGARDRGQALTLYKMCEQMMRHNEWLWEQVQPKETSKEIIMADENNNTKIQAISSDALSAHGLSPSVGIVDELHAQRNGALIEALETGMGAREQPLMIFITTADIDRPSVCNEELEYAKDIRDGKIANPQYLPIIFESSPDDPWDDPETWAKVNPTYPITPSHDFLSSEVMRAKSSKRKELSFKRLFLNMKTASIDGWLNMDFWHACKVDFNEDSLIKQDCYAGLDLSAKLDLTTIQLFFPDTGHIISRFYLPKDTIAKDPTGHYEEWAEEGFLTICGKEFIDYGQIIEELAELHQKYNIKETAIDTWNATLFESTFKEKHGISLTAYTQSMKFFNEPSKELEAMILSNRIKHNNPVLTWNATNVTIIEDASGNIRPDKPKRASALKIDGIVALIMAIGLWIGDGKNTQESFMNSENFDDLLTDLYS